MRMPATFKITAPLLLVWLVFFSFDAHAAIDSAGVLDSVLTKYQTAASGWATYITSRASWLYWTLVLISMVWTFGMMALRKADLGEFFAEFTRFTITTGFFWWLLTNGPNFATGIYTSLRQIASSASGLSNALTPSGIVDIGFDIFYRVLDQSSVWSPVDSACGIIIAIVILVILALVAVNMLLLLVSGWILAYAGVFFLGFGGSRWTSDMAINFYKTVLGVAAQLMTMVLIVGIGKTFLDDYYTRMSTGISLKEMGVMLIVSVVLLMLVNKLPGVVSGIITGAGIGHSGIGNFGAGAALGAAGAAAGAAAMGGAMIAAGATSAAGGASAIMAAFSKASENVQSGSDTLTSMWGGGSGGDQGGGSGSGSGADAGGSSEQSGTTTPFAQAAGMDSTGGGKGGSSSGDNQGAGKGADQGGGSSSGGGEQASASGKSGGGEGQGAQAGQGQSQGGESSDSGSKGFLAAAATAGKIAVDAGANLAKGTAEVAKAKAASIRDAAKDRIAETTGGKIAAAIRGNDSGATSAPTFEGNSLGGAGADEVAAFANRDQRQA